MPALRVLNPLADPSWDTALAHFPDATIFHSSAWARVLHRTYGYDPTYLLLGTPEAPRAALPLMDIRSWLTGHRGVSLPFTDHCEPLGSTPSDFTDLLAAAQSHGRSRGWKTLELRGGQTWFCQTPSHQSSTSYWVHRLNLLSACRSGFTPRPEVASSPRPTFPNASAENETAPAEAKGPNQAEALFANLDSSTRRAIKKAQAANLDLEVSTSLDAMRAFYGLMCRTRQRHGVPPQPWSFFENLQREILAPGHGCIVLAGIANAVISQISKPDRSSRMRATGVAAEACPPWQVTRQASAVPPTSRLLTSAATFDGIVIANASAPSIQKGKASSQSSHNDSVPSGSTSVPSVSQPEPPCDLSNPSARTPIAGAVYLHSDKVVHYKYGASDDSYQHLRANNLVMWHAIQWHAERGFTALDFGRTSLSNEGLRRFKLGWGTEESRLDYIKLDLRTGEFLTVPDRASGWHTRVFRALPLPLSRLVGRLLYRHIG